VKNSVSSENLFAISMIFESGLVRIFNLNISSKKFLVVGTNPNQTESGSRSFGLGIRSIQGSESASPNPHPGSVANNFILTNCLGENSTTFFRTFVIYLTIPSFLHTHETSVDTFYSSSLSDTRTYFFALK
jgi:hypothetical protein